MRSAYYSRNRSYSRSYNAELAESYDRYPLTRAAQHLELSASAFKKGLALAGIETTEWHHVSKYANEVDYYDVGEDSEIVNSSKFWKGAMNRVNKEYCNQMRLKALKKEAKENLEWKFTLWSFEDNPKRESFKKKAMEIFHPYFIGQLIYRYSNTGQWLTGRSIYGERSGFVVPFDLSPKGIKQKRKELRMSKYYSNDERIIYSFNPENVLRILRRYLKGVVAHNTLSTCSYRDFKAAAKIISRLRPDAVITDENGYIQISLPPR